MIPEIAALPYVPEKHLSAAGIRKVGVGLFIIDPLTSHIWVIEELKDKNGPDGTGRKKNTLSIPLETRKTGEKIIANVIGALAEFRQLHDREELCWLDGQSYLGRFLLIEGVAVDLVRIGIRNKVETGTAVVDSQEVRPVGWRSLEELTANACSLREGVPDLLRIASENGWIAEFVRLINAEQQYQRRLNPSMDIQKNHGVREQGQDI